MREQDFTQRDASGSTTYGGIPVPRLRTLIAQSIVGDLHGLPYPVQFRNQGALQGWRDEFEHGGNRPLWQRWAEQGFTCRGCSYTIDALFRSVRPHDLREAQQWDWDTEGLGDKIGANLFHARRGGALFEVTPALETLLMHSDFDKTLPMRLVAPPYAAQYLRFGEQAGRALCPFTEERANAAIDGVFCFVALRPAADVSQPPMRYLEFAFIVKEQGRFAGIYNMEQRIDSPQTGLTEWVEQMLAHHMGAPKTTEAMRQRTLALVGFVAKVFLYLGLKDARQVMLREHSDAQERGTGTGSKKKMPKLGQRRLQALYDRIVVGPDALPPTSHAGQAGHAVAPHWRRGHFRMQAHGEGYSQHKLIFVAPVLVHAVRLAPDEQEASQPKNYRVRV